MAPVSIRPTPEPPIKTQRDASLFEVQRDAHVGTPTAERLCCMWPPITRHLIFPLHEWLLRRRTFHYVRALEASQWLSPDEMAALQRRKLEALFSHAAARVPFYQQRFREAGVSPGSGGDPFELLRRLPLLSKDDIRRHESAMLWHDAPGGLHRHNTGGSTGEPLIFRVDRRRQGYDQAARIRTHRWFGADIGDRELYLWGSPIEWRRADSVKRFRDGLFNHRLLNAFELSPQHLEHYARVLSHYRPASLFGYPSSLALFARFLQDRGLPVAKTAAPGSGPSCGFSPGLQAVFVTGEVCLAHDRELIGEVFGVPVADCYGSREGGFVSHQCEEGSYHITAENLIVEILDAGGEALPAGEVGEIVVTHLDAYGMPFIRYRTGDHSRLLPGRCPCGRGLPLMDVVRGRRTDFLHLPDGTVRHALSIIYPLREQMGIAQFRVEQQADFSLNVMVVPGNGAATTLEPCLIERLVRPVVGSDCAVRVEIVERIPVSPSGKHRYVVSHVPPHHAGEEAAAASKPTGSPAAVVHLPGGIAESSENIMANGAGRTETLATEEVPRA